MAAIALQTAAEKRLKRLIRVEMYLKDRLNPLENLLPNVVKENYRFNPETILYLVHLLGPKLERKTRRSMALPVYLQVLIALCFLASGSHFKVIGDALQVSKSTVCICVEVVTTELVKMARQEIVFPSMSSLVNIKTAFKAIAGIPNVCGCADGCFIRIKKPKINTHEFMCRKKFAAINIQVRQIR